MCPGLTCSRKCCDMQELSAVQQELRSLTSGDASKAAVPYCSSSTAPAAAASLTNHPARSASASSRHELPRSGFSATNVPHGGYGHQQAVGPSSGVNHAPKTAPSSSDAPQPRWALQQRSDVAPTSSSSNQAALSEITNTSASNSFVQPTGTAKVPDALPVPAAQVDPFAAGASGRQQGLDTNSSTLVGVMEGLSISNGGGKQAHLSQPPCNPLTAPLPQPLAAQGGVTERCSSSSESSTYSSVAVPEFLREAFQRAGCDKERLGVIQSKLSSTKQMQLVVKSSLRRQEQGIAQAKQRGDDAAVKQVSEQKIEGRCSMLLLAAVVDWMDFAYFWGLGSLRRSGVLQPATLFAWGHCRIY